MLCGMLETFHLIMRYFNENFTSYLQWMWLFEHHWVQVHSRKDAGLAEKLQRGQSVRKGNCEE